MLQNSFYTVAGFSQDANSLQASIRIDPAHDIFKGHFPGQPVVPGVCMVQIVKEFMEQATGRELLFRKGSQLKFLQLLTPSTEETIGVQISWREEDGRYLTQADFRKDTGAVFKLNGIFSGH